MEGSDSKRNFFKHVFSLEGDSKSEVLNICQYSLLAIIPILLLNKTMRRFSPEIDDKKSSIEITLEVLIQILVIFIMLFIIHRIVTFVPTYSGMEYGEINMIQIILIALLFLFSFQTSISEKSNILVQRIADYWEGKSSSSSSKKKKGTSSNSSGQQQQQQQMPSNSAISMTGNPVQPTPDYNDFYSKDTTPLVGASSPGGGSNAGSEGFGQMMPSLAQGGAAALGLGEPMAANAVLGGSSFGNSQW